MGYGRLRPGSPGSGPRRNGCSACSSELFDETAFPFRYNGRETYTAMEAFQRREGNCLSFTNLFVAMGRSLGFQVTTALVRRAQATEKEGDLIIVNDHVVAALAYGPNWFYFDFDRRPHERPMAVQPLDDLWITALYLNNRGADELRAAHPDIALRYFDWATKLAPTFAPAWGNVGVARRRTGDINGAFAAYSHALTIAPEDSTILGNLASLYRATGREHEAELALKAINVANATPHTLIVRGDLELAQGHVRAAFRLYKRAPSLAPRLADPWVALARAELARSRRSPGDGRPRACPPPRAGRRRRARPAARDLRAARRPRPALSPLLCLSGEATFGPCPRAPHQVLPFTA